MQNPKILIVEDETSIADNILYALQLDNFDPFHVQTGEEALVLLAKDEYDLVILDVGLPGIDGFEVCRRTRQTSKIPIIFLTCRDSEIDRVVGLEIGADDYVIKPFSMRELSARVRAILRRTEGGDGEEAEKPSGLDNDLPIAIDFKRHIVHYFNEEVRLSQTEFSLLAILVEHPGWVYSRMQLKEKIWDQPESTTDRTIDAHVKSLRRKLRNVNSDIDPIITHHGVGYSLRADW